MYIDNVKNGAIGVKKKGTDSIQPQKRKQGHPLRLWGVSLFSLTLVTILKVIHRQTHYSSKFEKLTTLLQVFSNLLVLSHFKMNMGY